MKKPFFFKPRLTVITGETSDQEQKILATDLKEGQGLENNKQERRTSVYTIVVSLLPISR